MLKKRLIPCLFLKNGHLVRSQNFRFHQLLGDPIQQVNRLSDWGADELIYVDISREEVYDLRRDDLKIKRMNDIYTIIESVSKSCFIPLTFGGNIRTIDDIRQRINRGADKVVINTQAYKSPELISLAAKVFGKQCVIVGIDVQMDIWGKYEVVIDHGHAPTGKNPVAWASEAEGLGAGEIFLNSIDRDGTAEGYDIALIKSVVEVVNIPVIACGGVGVFDHFADGITEGHADAVAAGNIFNFTENAVITAKKTLQRYGLDVRPVIKKKMTMGILKEYRR